MSAVTEKPEEIEYEITLRVTMPAGLPETAPRPFEKAFYAPTNGEVAVIRAQRITSSVAYGGPR